MYKVATITFHHAHNFGSVLQAYALQEFVESLAEKENKKLEYTIIDFYPKVQKELYNIFKSKKNPQNIIKNVFSLLYLKKLKIKHKKFDEFIEEYCNLSKRYETEEELKNNYPKADCYISGSDQLWNVRASDFSKVYYYNFLPDSCRRVSYAASLGPLKIDWSRYDAIGCSEFLNHYAAVSVREQGSLENIQAISNIECSIHVDPTLLIAVEKWRKIESKANYNDGKYILLYCLEPSKKQLAIANAISEEIGLPILVLRYNNKNDMFNHYIKKYDAGPEDFLAYIDHAALVLSSSFHGTAFSILYNKPFYCLNGMEDNRIASLLKKTGMEDRAIKDMDQIRKVSLALPDEQKINEFLETERCLSEKYLKETLKIK